jgi:hypothetical protein
MRRTRATQNRNPTPEFDGGYTTRHPNQRNNPRTPLEISQEESNGKAPPGERPRRGRSGRDGGGSSPRPRIRRRAGGGATEAWASASAGSRLVGWSRGEEREWERTDYLWVWIQGDCCHYVKVRGCTLVFL